MREPREEDGRGELNAACDTRSVAERYAALRGISEECRLLAFDWHKLVQRRDGLALGLVDDGETWRCRCGGVREPVYRAVEAQAERGMSKAERQNAASVQQIMRVPVGQPVPVGWVFVKWLGTDNSLVYGSSAGYVADVVLVERINA